MDAQHSLEHLAKRQRVDNTPLGGVLEPPTSATQTAEAQSAATNNTSQPPSLTGQDASTHAPLLQPESRPYASGAYTSREEALIHREGLGEISFEYVENNSDPRNMVYLIGLKNIFSKQLPNMPKEYIVRLVMDRRHRSVALVKKSGLVVGGITYRAFHQQAFGEIAFCAITSSEQVKGYGTRLMNYTKEYARTKDHLQYFLTYADNAAVGYFEKQGFTKAITFSSDRWQGYIKDYDGGTLMECALHPKVQYTRLPEMIHAQRLALDAQIRNLSKSHVVHKGLDHWKGPSRTHISIDSITGVKEAGWVPPPKPRYQLLLKDGRKEATPDHLQAFMQQLLDELKKADDSWPFREAVSMQDAPDYYEIIKDPIDLNAIQERLDSRSYYLTLDIYSADIRRVFDNCRYYNSADTIYFKLANKLQAFVNTYLSSHLVFDA